MNLIYTNPIFEHAFKRYKGGKPTGVRKAVRTIIATPGFKAEFLRRGGKMKPTTTASPTTASASPTVGAQTAQTQAGKQPSRTLRKRRVRPTSQQVGLARPELKTTLG